MLAVDFRGSTFYYCIKQLPNPKKHCRQAPNATDKLLLLCSVKKDLERLISLTLSMKMLITLDNFIIKLPNMAVFKTFRDISSKEINKNR